jgi:hypothetical protein
LEGGSKAQGSNAIWTVPDRVADFYFIFLISENGFWESLVQGSENTDLPTIEIDFLAVTLGW